MTKFYKFSPFFHSKINKSIENIHRPIVYRNKYRIHSHVLETHSRVTFFFVSRFKRWLDPVDSIERIVTR